MKDRDGLRLKQDVVQAIEEQHGKITFARFMELILYHETEGYYQNDMQKLGKSGDFYTSAHIGSAMGQCVAAQLAEASRLMNVGGDPVTIVEWGGGDGRLAKAVLDELREAHASVYSRVAFMAVENSPLHRERIRSALSEHADVLIGISAADEPVVADLLRNRKVLVFANELLDAFPVHRLKWNQGEWKEIYVAWDEKTDAFDETLGPVAEPAAAAWLRERRIRGREGQVIEVNWPALDWIGSLGGNMREGFVMLIDYGDITAELLAPHRMNGTLTCYRNHLASDNPYEYLGQQDMTAHVNFEWVMEKAAAAGFEQLLLRTQKQFLVDNGILDRLRDHDGADPFSETARSNRAIRQLLLSDGMSELFKVLTMQKRPYGKRRK